MKNTILWIGALVVGAIMGLLGISWLNEVMNSVATVYMRLFQLLAVPTIVLAVITTFATFGCYFLTLSLMTGIGAPVAVMGIILPIYTIIDMVETAENVWSDSCVCAMTDHDIK